MILCISVLSVVISPFSFLILLIWFFSLCFLMSLANGLSTNLKNIQATPTAQLQKNKWPNQKMGQRSMWKHLREKNRSVDSQMFLSLTKSITKKRFFLQLNFYPVTQHFIINSITCFPPFIPTLNTIGCYWIFVIQITRSCF